MSDPLGLLDVPQWNRVDVWCQKLADQMFTCLCAGGALCDNCGREYLYNPQTRWHDTV